MFNYWLILTYLIKLHLNINANSIILPINEYCDWSSLVNLFPNLPNNEIAIINNNNDNGFNLPKYNATILVLQEPFNIINTAIYLKVKNMIVTVNDNEEIYSIITKLQFIYVWNKCYSSGANFIIICKYCSLNVFKKLWSKDIVSIILCNFTHVISSTPYKRENMCGQKFEWFLTESCKDIKSTRFNKIPNNCISSFQNI